MARAMAHGRCRRNGARHGLTGARTGGGQHERDERDGDEPLHVDWCPAPPNTVPETGQWAYADSWASDSMS